MWHCQWLNEMFMAEVESFRSAGAPGLVKLFYKQGKCRFEHAFLP